MTWALVADSHPSVIASPTGASNGSFTAVASRTVARPAPLWPPATEVTKSWVEAHPAPLTASVASSSRTTPRTRASTVDFNASASDRAPISSSLARAAHNVSVSSRTSSRKCLKAAGTPSAHEVPGGSLGWSCMWQFKHRPLTGTSENSLA